MADHGTLPSLAQKSAGSANSCRIWWWWWDYPLAVGIVHTLLEERPMNGSSLMKEHCLFCPRKSWGSHPVGRSLGKVFLCKRRRLPEGLGVSPHRKEPGGEGPSAWSSCPSSEPFSSSVGAQLELPCSFTSVVHHPFYFLCHLLLPTSFYLPNSQFPPGLSCTLTSQDGLHTWIQSPRPHSASCVYLRKRLTS